jgi:two-component system response regulator GlrR
VFGYLTKPFQAEALLAEVQSALRAGAGEASPSGASELWRNAIITRSPAIEGVLREAKLVADTDASVFISGQSGTGKELLARAIHAASPRHRRLSLRSIAVRFRSNYWNESFGHVKGSFTGAIRDHKGLFEATAGGRCFSTRSAICRSLCR